MKQKKSFKNKLLVMIVFTFIMVLSFANKVSAAAEPELKKLALSEYQKSIVTFDDKLYLDFDPGITKNDNEFFSPSVVIRNKETNENAIVYIIDVWEKPYITFTNTVSPGKYYISDVFLPNNKHYSNVSDTEFPLDFNVEFYLTDSLDVIKSFTIENDDVIPQDGIVTFNIDFRVKPESISVSMVGDNGNSMAFLVKGTDNLYTADLSKEYSKLPVGDYRIKNAYLFYGNDIIAYDEYKPSNGVARYDFNFDVKFKVESKNIVEKPTLKSISITNGKEFDWGDSLDFSIDFDGYVDFVTASLVNKTVPGSGALICIYDCSEGKARSIALSSEGIYSLQSQRDRMVAGEYYISDVFLNPSKKDSYVHYSVNPQDDETRKLDSNVEFTIKEKEEKPSNNILNNISFTENAKLNEKVFVNIDTTVSLSSAKLVFEGKNKSESMIVTLKDITAKPYFIVPITTSDDTYSLTYVILKDSEGNEIQYRDGADYNGIIGTELGNTINITEEIDNSNLLYLDNDKITDEIIDKLANMPNNVKIELNANSNSIVKKELFEAIKGANKTLIINYQNIEWIFNGLNITTPKQIDTLVSIQKIKDNVAINELTNEGVVIDFANN